MTEQSQAAEWIAAAKRGDQFALAKLLTLCGPQLRGRLLEQGPPAIRARYGVDDILQETYADILCHIEDFRGEDLSSFQSWAGVILEHTLRDIQRAAHAGMRDVDREVVLSAGSGSSSYWNLLDHLHASVGTPSHYARTQEAVAALESCIATLREAQREVIRLRFYEDRTLDEVATQLGISKAAAAALTLRALHALRIALDERGEFTKGSG